MPGLFVLRFYHPDKTDKMDRLIHSSGSKIAFNFNFSSVVKQLMYVLKLFRVTTGSIYSFRICNKETLRIMYLKYIRFWIRSEESTSVVDYLDQKSVFGF